jgi:hypothetical protein
MFVMSGYLIIVLLGLILVLLGFSMAFRQSTVRRLLGRPAPPRSHDEDEDPLAYALRISGVMIMAFGVAIGVMFTIVHILS